MARSISELVQRMDPPSKRSCRVIVSISLSNMEANPFLCDPIRARQFERARGRRRPGRSERARARQRQMERGRRSKTERARQFGPDGDQGGENQPEADGDQGGASEPEVDGASEPEQDGASQPQQDRGKALSLHAGPREAMLPMVAADHYRPTQTIVPLFRPSPPQR